MDGFVLTKNTQFDETRAPNTKFKKQTLVHVENLDRPATFFSSFIQSCVHTECN
eukprot:m.519296 g.519296  ORF g.519296 m.519296 type:complete len:54 (+) comp136176_c0_seq1:70-231(+)